jgi:hypothetical protein
MGPHGRENDDRWCYAGERFFYRREARAAGEAADLVEFGGFW